MLYFKLLCEIFDWRYSIIFDNFGRFKFWTQITTKRFKLVKQNLKGAHLNNWSTINDYIFYKFIQSNQITIVQLNKVQ